jgi:hypothetical protein
VGWSPAGWEEVYADKTDPGISPKSVSGLFAEREEAHEPVETGGRHSSLGFRGHQRGARAASAGTQKKLKRKRIPRIKTTNPEKRIARKTYSERGCCSG